MAIYELNGAGPQFPDDFYWVAPSATVIGQVIIGPQVGIWFGTTIRGDNEPIEIGARSNIQDHCVLHTDPGYPIKIGTGCTIGHKAMIHGCIVGDNSLIGMGATLLNNVRIGKNCLIGAGTLMPEGREVPDNSLVMGAPGRVIRELDQAAIEGLRNSAELYVANARRFASGLQAVSS